MSEISGGGLISWELTLLETVWCGPRGPTVDVLVLQIDSDRRYGQFYPRFSYAPDLCNKGSVLLCWASPGFLVEGSFQLWASGAKVITVFHTMGGCDKVLPTEIGDS